MDKNRKIIVVGINEDDDQFDLVKLRRGDAVDYAVPVSREQARAAGAHFGEEVEIVLKFSAPAAPALPAPNTKGPAAAPVTAKAVAPAAQAKGAPSVPAKERPAPAKEPPPKAPVPVPAQAKKETPVPAQAAQAKAKEPAAKTPVPAQTKAKESAAKTPVPAPVTAHRPGVQHEAARGPTGTAESGSPCSGRGSHGFRAGRPVPGPGARAGYCSLWVDKTEKRALQTFGWAKQSQQAHILASTSVGESQRSASLQARRTLASPTHQ
jgi:outer membrane biosynthesis protein TonB